MTTNHTEVRSTSSRSPKTVSDPLPISGHRLFESVVERGSVKEWKCKDCEKTSSDVMTYLNASCEE